jgi:two-component system, cell cycle response regulator DivK
MSDERVLVVDDNPTNSKLLTFVLTNHGYHVRTAEHAAQALEVLEQFDPQLILMDIQLPGMDGLSLTRLIKANPATRHIVVVAVTAAAMKGDEDKARASGCDAYITKPIDTRRLSGQLRELLAPRGDPGGAS